MKEGWICDFMLIKYYLKGFERWLYGIEFYIVIFLIFFIYIWVVGMGDKLFWFCVNC